MEEQNININTMTVEHRRIPHKIQEICPFQLREALGARDLDITGNKQTLIQRLQEAIEADAGEQQPEAGAVPVAIPPGQQTYSPKELRSVASNFAKQLIKIDNIDSWKRYKFYFATQLIAATQDRPGGSVKMEDLEAWWAIQDDHQDLDLVPHDIDYMINLGLAQIQKDLPKSTRVGELRSIMMISDGERNAP